MSTENVPGASRSDHNTSWKRLIGKFIYSPAGRWLANLPPFSWMIRGLARRLVQRQLGQPAPLKEREPSVDLESALRGIAYDVVEALGYTGAMVATYDPGDALPVRALYVDPEVLSNEQMDAWVQEISTHYGVQRLSLTDPEIARVFMHDPAFRDNLSVRAAHERQPVVSDELFDLFTPVVPYAARSAVAGIQQALGIRQVVAVPFFIEATQNGETKKEYVGNLFAARQEEITAVDVRLLSAFARQVATAILSERRRVRANILQQLILDMHRSLGDEDQILARIAQGVVDDLGYAGAMVATYEAGDALPVRAFYIDPGMVDMQQVQSWTEQISTQYIGRPISLSDPKEARVYVHQESYQGNLSVKAAKERGPVVSDYLFDLFTPIVPEAARSALLGIQQALGIRQVIAAPFFIETFQDGKLEREFVGNLFAATRSDEFQKWEIELLGAFGQQAAAGLKNARLYRRAEARRLAAEIFGKMAFSATASLHAFRNHVGVIRMGILLLDKMGENGISADAWKQQSPILINRLDRLAELLEGLHEPFRQARDLPVNVNDCIRYALVGVNAPEPWVKLDLNENLPEIRTMPEMLSEAFKVLIKNAVEAIREKAETANRDEVYLFVTSRLSLEGNVEVEVRDRGSGIRLENMGRIFELGVTTKSTGLGFGLFWTKDYIEGLGGSLSLESQWGVGTTMTISLPPSAQAKSDDEAEGE